MTIVRKMHIADVSEVERLLVSTWPNHPRVARSCRRELEDMFSTAEFRPTFFVAEDSGVIVGCGAWNWSSLNCGTYEISWAAVKAEHRGCGIGRQLVQARLDDIRDTALSQGESIYLVLVSTHLTRMYERYGFHRARVRFDAGLDREPAYLMVRRCNVAEA